MSDERPGDSPLDEIFAGEPVARRVADDPRPTEQGHPAPKRALPPEGGPRVTKKRMGLTALGIVLALVLAIGGLVAYYLVRVNNALDSVKRESYAPTNADRPSDPQVTGPQPPMTFVLMGSDSRGTDDARSDTLMVAYLPANRQHVYVVSIPRDTYVEVPTLGKTKINAAFAKGKMPLTMQTLEKLFQVKMQHAAMVDFESFIRLTDVLGGVTVDNPQESWVKPYYYPAGKITVKGEEALAFVRQRHDLKDGDLTRALRQRQMIKGIVTKALSMGVLANPAKFGELLDQVSKLVTVDSELTNDIIKNTAMGLHLRSGEDVRGLSIPLSGYQMHPQAGAIDLLDEKRMTELAKAMQTDQMDAYWEAHKDDPLIGAPTSKPSTKTSATPSAKPSPSPSR